MRTGRCSTSSAAFISSSGIRTKRTHGRLGRTKGNGLALGWSHRLRMARFDGPIEGFKAVRHPFDREGLDDLLPTALAHRPSTFRVREDPLNLVGKVPGIHGIRQEALAAVLEQ